mgnify:CR=1 FL=1
MNRQEIQEKINALIEKGEWFDIVQLIKNDDSDYAIYYLIQIAIGQRNTLERLNNLIKESLGK